MIRKDRSKYQIIDSAINVGLTLLFTTLVVLVQPDQLTTQEGVLNLILLVLGFMLSMAMATTAAKTLLIQFAQNLYNLSVEDTEGLVQRILYGLPVIPPFNPTLRVEKGRVDPDGPEVLRKVGGPGFLSVAHDSAVVVARGGTLVDVLGPGFHPIGAFVKVWDVADLRPQRRKVKVEATTRDGIPVFCEAEVLFHLKWGDKPTQEESPPAPYPVTDAVKETILNLTTGKVALAPGGKSRFTKWTKRVAAGILDGAIRDRMEQYCLDDLLSSDNTIIPPVEALEKEIHKAVSESAGPMGIKIEEVHLGPVLPAEDAISQQWIETWRSEWEGVAAGIRTETQASEAEAIELARVRAEADLVTAIVQEMKSHKLEDTEIPPALIVLRLVDAMRALAEGDPMVRSTLFQQAESLKRILESIRGESLPDTKRRPPALSSSE